MGNSSVVREVMGGEASLVVSAASGDEDAFRELLEPLAGELHRFCYRMLGSTEDAEEVVQDARLKAWRGLGRYDRRSTFRTWIYRITTNACLDALRSRQRRLLPRDLGPRRDAAQGLGEQRPDIAWLEPFTGSAATVDPHAILERRESIRLAFVHALHRLPPRQRAALILREVLDWSAAEVASALDTSVPAVNSALQRARATMTSADVNVDAPTGTSVDRRTANIAARYVAAWESGDMTAIVSMLTDDVIQSMPPWEGWFVGRENVRRLYSGYDIWAGRPGPRVFRVIPASLHGDLVFAEYCREAPGGPYRALALTVARLTADHRRIAEKVSFVRGDVLTSLGFPSVLD